jgi:hypothetical protein
MGPYDLAMLCSAALALSASTPQESVTEERTPTHVAVGLVVESEELEAGFGFALAEVGDWNGDGRTDVAVSAPWISIDRPGVVRVLSGWDGELLGEFTGDAPADWFGYSLAGGLDLDGDGISDLAIGAPGDPAGGGRRGCVRFVSGRTRALSDLRIDGSEDQACCGEALATLGDLDGDGRPELAVGAPGEGRARGVVRVHSGESLEVLRTFRGRAAEHRFGAALASARDLDGDGFDDVIVGAPNEGRDRPESGTVRVYSGATGRLLRSIIDSDRFARLGSSVAGLGDVTGDGWSEFVAAAPTRELGELPDVGRVTVYDGRTGAALYYVDGQQAGDFLGRGLAAGRDVNNDGWPDLVIGVPFALALDEDQEKEGARRGALLVLSGPDGSELARFEGERESRLHGWAATFAGQTSPDLAVVCGAPGRAMTLIEEERDRLRGGRVTLHPVLESGRRRRPR